MRFGVLALDYDGTIEHAGTIHPAVRDAIIEVRRRGISVVLVTGRILDDVQREIVDLRLFDAVVAENGAVVVFPDSGRSQVLGAAAPPAFVDDLRRTGIAYRAGECVIEADAAAAADVLEVIRRLGLPYAIQFNRERLMILPQAVSKGTGLREALTALRLSVHNAVAIGDAENDHQLLEAVELGIAVQWGHPALQAVADEVLPGTGPEAVAECIVALARDARLPPSRVGRRALLLGRAEDDRPLALAVRGRNVLIAGDPRSGKSWIAGLLCEQLILHRYGVCVIDPEGDYRPLEALPGVLVVEGTGRRPRLHDLQHLLRHPDVSVVLDLAAVPVPEKREWVRSVLRLLKTLRRQSSLPHRILVDEAHYFLHDPDVLDLLDLDLAGYTFATYQASALHPDVLAAVEAILVTRETDPREVLALWESFGAGSSLKEWERTLGSLGLDEAALLPGPDEASGRLRTFRIAPRLTRHVRHQRKYVDVSVPDRHAFEIMGPGVPPGTRAHTLEEFVRFVAAFPESIRNHLSRGDVSRWIQDVFGDQELAFRVHELEDQVQLSRVLDPGDALVSLIQERYAIGGPGVEAAGTRSTPSAR